MLQSLEGDGDRTIGSNPLKTKINEGEVGGE